MAEVVVLAWHVETRRCRPETGIKTFADVTVTPQLVFRLTRDCYSITRKMITGKSDSPPPAYSAIPSIDSTEPSAEQQSASTSHLHLATTSCANEAAILNATFPQQHPHRAYGPTPIPQQLERGVLLPYYDPQSPYAMQQAVSRARWRFFGAFLWALGIWVAFGLVTGGIVIDIRRP
ncbi:uncharacterized protein FOMMEDRAFT_158692 [Fomitiporia mediterranea MF3/22]|uniref:uncharacterized protein n=1 Tax=Fomitiporia mediterranea (strain MF3/22) TaxID=694068 RepID=UPI0004408571|nr:uncharacterized protein FOMMEDRAFT_158692 [Fomitiporia mediterranea MF3/22]EJD01539.1 hypothetical protein FOMMEDRAFT_158692 [Fomitiporia mediterranea MF3/22]